MIVEKFIQTYQQLNKDNLELLESIYCENTIFIDPFHKLDNLKALKSYFSKLYNNVLLIEFNFIETSSLNKHHYLTWNMLLTHTTLNQGKTFCVSGITHLITNDNHKIRYHRDYFDAGSMLYERLPFLGKLIGWVKRKL